VLGKKELETAWVRAELWMLRRMRKKSDTGRRMLCSDKEDVKQILLGCSLENGERYFETSVAAMNEGVVYTKILSCTNKFCFKMWVDIQTGCGPRWPRGLRSGSAAARLLVLRVRIPPLTWKSVFFECFVLSGRGLCVGLITCLEESYRVRCV
jgi:hypothetical protein